MTQLVPNRLLFRFEFPLRYRADLPALDGSLLGWRDAELLPRLGELDGQAGYADVWACWNERGLAVACRVAGKRAPLRCDPDRFWAGDNLRICTDMRDARGNKRATRYCQQFYFLAAGGGRGGREPVAGVNPIKRAQAPAPTVPAGRLRVGAVVGKTGYQLEALIPAACLSGFDPIEHPRIGFFYMIEDADHGQQYLTVGDDLYWYLDPSTWATAVLARSAAPGSRGGGTRPD